MSEITKKPPVIIDTDPGLDDAASILWVIASQKYDIKALTVTNGNVGLKACVINALKILEASNRTDIPVYVGAYRPLVRPTVDAAWVHGSDGLGDAGIPMPSTKPAKGYAAAEMVKIVNESPNPVTILALGPLTNVALAILLDSDFANNVKQVLFMGGAVRVPGNESPCASFNAAVDPEAAKVVYNSGIPIVQLGLDVCDQVTETFKDLDTIKESGTKMTEFFTKIVNYRREGALKKPIGEGGNTLTIKGRQNGIALNDLVTTAYLINPDWFKTEHITMDIDTSGLCPGQTVADFRGLWARKPNCLWAYDVDNLALVAQWVKDMCSYKPASV